MTNILNAIVDWVMNLCNPDMTPDQVAAALQSRADAKTETLNWKGSIVDLLKVMDLDSGYGARSALARDLGVDGYTGTAAQNIAMYKLLVNEIAKNKIKMPPVVEG